MKSENGFGEIVTIILFFVCLVVFTLICLRLSGDWKCPDWLVVAVRGY